MRAGGGGGPGGRARAPSPAVPAPDTRGAQVASWPPHLHHMLLSTSCPLDPPGEKSRHGQTPRAESPCPVPEAESRRGKATRPTARTATAGPLLPGVVSVFRSKDCPAQDCHHPSRSFYQSVVSLTNTLSSSLPRFLTWPEAVQSLNQKKEKSKDDKSKRRGASWADGLADVFQNHLDPVLPNRPR